MAGALIYVAWSWYKMCSLLLVMNCRQRKLWIIWYICNSIVFKTLSPCSCIIFSSQQLLRTVLFEIQIFTGTAWTCIHIIFCVYMGISPYHVHRDLHCVTFLLSLQIMKLIFAACSMTSHDSISRPCCRAEWPDSWGKRFWKEHKQTRLLIHAQEWITVHVKK